MKWYYGVAAVAAGAVGGAVIAAIATPKCDGSQPFCGDTKSAAKGGAFAGTLIGGTVGALALVTPEKAAGAAALATAAAAVLGLRLAHHAGGV